VLVAATGSQGKARIFAAHLANTSTGKNFEAIKIFAPNSKSHRREGRFRGIIDGCLDAWGASGVVRTARTNVRCVGDFSYLDGPEKMVYVK
jgi:hypothetical protein